MTEDHIDAERGRCNLGEDNRGWGNLGNNNGANQMLMEKIEVWTQLVLFVFLKIWICTFNPSIYPLSAVNV